MILCQGLRVHTLFITSKSDCEIPGPPFLGILSPPLRRDQDSSRVVERNRTHRNIDHVDNIIRQLPRIIRRQIISSTLNQEQLTLEFRLQSFKSTHICTDVFANSSMRTASSLDGEDSVDGKGTILDQKFLVFAREDVVCDGSWNADEI